MKSVMSHNFSQVPRAEIPRSQFNRSHGYKTTFDSGYIVPVLVEEALPGDTYNVSMTAFARLATPIVPFMDNLVLDTFFFAVPYRLVWDNWQKFNGEQVDPGDSTDYEIPQMVSTAVTGYTIGSLHDYFGLPTGKAGYTHSALFHRAYNLIYNQWFRDQNLQDSVVVDRDDGPDLPADYVLLRRGKRHDYFTSCLPWPQKGTAVSIPLGTSAPVLGIATRDNAPYTNNVTGYLDSSGVAPTGSNWSENIDNTLAGVRIQGNNTTHVPNIYADLSTATAATINSLREAFQIQKLFERDARGGTRYTEIILSHFGVTSPDARLQRPEYLGGSSAPVNVSPIAQTSSTDATTPQGNLAAMGTLSVRGSGFVKSFTEHCLILGLVSVRADLNYQQGLNRMWSRNTRYDFYWPALSHIGEQAVLNKEIYLQATSADESVFGYQERYAEYRYKPSQITGLFRSTAAGTLDVWHLAQNFSSLPALNAAFIVEDPAVDRVIATPTEPHFLFDAYFNMITARPMPTYSVPGLIDHF